MDAKERRAELSAFLKARRAAIAPETLGLQRGRRRLTPGLRREELASLADIGVTWYTWLEQGREIKISPAALGRIARVLQLSPTDEVYLFLLAGLEPQTRRALDDTLPAWVQVTLDMFSGPAMAFNARLDVLAFNRLADALYEFDHGLMPFPRNHLWNAFMNPHRQRLYVDWHDVTERRLRVGFLRLTYAKHPDPSFDELISALSDASPDFAQIWNERTTTQFTPTTTSFFHPSFGNLEVHALGFPVEGTDGLWIALLTPANAETAAAFKRVGLTLQRKMPERAE